MPHRDLKEELSQAHGRYTQSENSQEKEEICTKCERADVKQSGLGYEHFLCRDCRSQGFLDEFDKEYR